MRAGPSVTISVGLAAEPVGGRLDEGSTAVPRLSRSLREGPLPARVYEHLRDQIVTGELPADAALVQEQIAQALGVSRTPVREALNRLTHEGLATWVPGNGYVVNGLTERDVLDVREVRRTLEPLATRLACGRHDPASVSRLTALVEQMAGADPGDSAGHFELNRRFHRALVEPCGNTLLIKMLDTLLDHPVSRRITRSYVSDPDNVALMVAEHRELVAAAAAADLQALVTLSERHVSSGYEKALRARHPDQRS